MSAQPEPIQHPRTRIRAAVVERLRGTTIAQNRVYPSRVKALRPNLLPALLVYTTTERVERVESREPFVLLRAVRLTVEGVVSLRDEWERLLDDFALQIENVVTFDPTQGRHAARTEYVETEESLVDQTPLLASVRVAYDVFYATDESPIGDLSELERIGAVWDIRPPQDSGESEPTDDIEFPEEG